MQSCPLPTRARALLFALVLAIPQAVPGEPIPLGSGGYFAEAVAIGDGTQGSASLDADFGAYTLSSKGSGLRGEADSLEFLHVQVTGDFEIRAQVSVLHHPATLSYAGVSVRESLEPGARFVSSVLTSGMGAALLSRAQTDAAIQASDFVALEAPRFVKLRREGATFSAFVSLDGVGWKRVGQASLAMSEQVFVGLAVSSWSPDVEVEAIFDAVALEEIDSAVPGGSSAAVLSLIAPESLEADELASVSLTFLNTGSQPWIASQGHRLVWAGTGSSPWSLDEVSLFDDEAVESGDTRDFVLDIQAPPVAGVYEFSFGMAQGGIVFGGVGGPEPVMVYAAAPPPETSPPAIGAGEPVGFARDYALAEFGSGVVASVDGSGDQLLLSMRNGSVFAYVPVEGDFDMVTRLIGYAEKDSNSRIGLALRKDLTGNAGLDEIVFRGDEWIGSYRKAGAGSPKEHFYGTAAMGAPLFLRLERRGNLLALQYSPNGIAWTSQWRRWIDWEGPAWAGAIGYSGNPDSVTEAILDDVVVEDLPEPERLPPAPGFASEFAFETVGNASARAGYVVDSNVIELTAIDGKGFASVAVEGDFVATTRVAAYPIKNGNSKLGLSARQEAAGSTGLAEIYVRGDRRINAHYREGVGRPFGSRYGPLNATHSAYLGLERRGRILRMLHSSDGVAWMVLWERWCDWEGLVQVGLLVDSGNPNEATAGAFEGTVVEELATSGEGPPATGFVSGLSASQWGGENGRTSVAANANGVGFEAFDGGVNATRRVSGDFAFSALVDGFTFGNPNSWIGLTAREISASGGWVELGYRLDGWIMSGFKSGEGVGATTQYLTNTLTAPLLLRLRRVGDQLFLDTSSDGVGWALRAQKTVSWGPDLMLGFVAKSGNPDECMAGALSSVAFEGTLWDDEPESLDAAFESQIGEAYLAIGAESERALAYRNVGDQAWSDQTGLRLVWTGDGPSPWGIESLALPFAEDVAPGEILAVAIPINAPSVPGQYRSAWSLADSAGSAFGEPSEEVVVTVVDPNQDSDGDGLPDLWEFQNLGSLEAGPEDDSDDDGLDNAIERRLGTHPQQTTIENAAASSVSLKVIAVLAR